MKYAITGHTGLVGGFLYNNLVTAWDSADPTDLMSLMTMHKIGLILESYKCDVFVNCAHAGPGTSQTDMLWKVYKRWKNHNKHIINIGTDRASPHLWSTVRQDYPLEKSILATTVDHIQKQHIGKCKVSIINPNVIENDTLVDILGAVKYIVQSRTYITTVNLQ